MFKQFSNLSCYEEFEIQATLAGISKIDILRKIGHQIYAYYFFVSTNGIFNWFDLEGNHVEDPGVLTHLKEEHILRNITKCVIPNSVTSIEDSAFYRCYSLKEITIPNSVIRIVDRAFSFCESLTSITLPNNVTNISDRTFRGCKSLKEIIIPNSVTRIGYEAFAYCKSLLSMTIPNSVTHISGDAFFYCDSLKEIIVPDSVTSISWYAFSGCKSLKKVIFKGRTLKEVKKMENFPFGIKNENVFKFS